MPVRLALHQGQSAPGLSQPQRRHWSPGCLASPSRHKHPTWVTDLEPHPVDHSTPSTLTHTPGPLELWEQKGAGPMGWLCLFSISGPCLSPVKGRGPPLMSKILPKSVANVFTPTPSHAPDPSEAGTLHSSTPFSKERMGGRVWPRSHMELAAKWDLYFCDLPSRGQAQETDLAPGQEAACQLPRGWQTPGAALRPRHLL